MTTPTDLFPNPELTPLPIDRKPTLHDIRLLKRQINANAMAITSTKGGGTFGHLAILMLPADYNALASTQPWINPVHPGLAPSIQIQCTTHG